MSNKRHREEENVSESVHNHHKRIRDEHGDAQRVDPSRFSQPFTADPFSMPLPSDDEHDHDHDNNKMAINSRSPSNEPNDADDTEFGLLLYELASLDVGNQNSNDLNHNNNAPQTCPICSRRVSLKEFPDHVHGCLDQMDDSERNDMRSQVEKDSDFATEYALKHGYSTNYDFGQCPSCGKPLILGQSMNEHVNQCLDEMEKRAEMKKNSMDNDDDEDDDIFGGNSNHFNNNHNKKKVKKVEPMSREQMIECASKLMTLQQGSEQFGNMLEMFGALGFNKQNVKSVLEIEKKQSNPNLHNNHNRNIDNNDNNNDHQQNAASSMHEDEYLSPIAEEDVDLFGVGNGNINHNDNRSKNNNQIDDNQQFSFDDDDL